MILLSHDAQILVTKRSKFVDVLQRQGYSCGNGHQAGNYKIPTLYLALG